MASGIPYMWPCAFHQKAKAPLAAACSKADGEMNSLSSKIEGGRVTTRAGKTTVASSRQRSEEPELQSQSNLVCRLLLEKKKEQARDAARLLAQRPVQRRHGF